MRVKKVNYLMVEIKSSLALLLKRFGYEIINESAATAKLVNSWRAPSVARKQRSVVEQQLDEIRAGKIPYFMQVASEILKSLGMKKIRLLDVGCGSGYYFEIFNLLNPEIKIDYTGVDYSRALIEMAQNIYEGQGARYVVAEATSFPFGDDQFEVVFSSAALMHVLAYQKAIKEHVRVSKQYVIFTRTPCVQKNKTRMLRQFAYGTELLALCFNETELLELFDAAGLKVHLEINLRESFRPKGLNEDASVKCFLCEKLSKEGRP